MLTCAALILLLTKNEARAEQEIRSGGYYLRACQAFLDKNEGGSYIAGQCAGAVFVMGYTLDSTEVICLPKGVTLGQTVRVILKYLENSPQSLHMDFPILALYALGAAWPCPARK